MKRKAEDVLDSPASKKPNKPSGPKATNTKKRQAEDSPKSPLLNTPNETSNPKTDRKNRKVKETPGSPLPKTLDTTSTPETCFREDLFTTKIRDSFTAAYKASKPYPHAVVPSLIQDELLRKVRKEITEHVHFTLKETDIYRIHQSGDLANLSKLGAEDLQHLPSLVKLRDALYSTQFRTWISSVTGAGNVSGTKTDMAINVYTPGSYLLCHDDVIGSRRVSYILYLTDPDESWKPEWGGGLRLYPTEVKKNAEGEEVKVPLAEHTENIPPSFGQLSFFAVRPGESYHDVEEVYHGKGGQRIRMAISGWYHIPQEGEDGYEAGAEEAQAQKSSLSQLKGAANEFDEPTSWFRPFPEIGKKATADDDILTESELTFLLKYIAPQYLTPDMTEKASEAFIEASVMELEGFLSPALANEMERWLKDVADTKDWRVARPPHKHRYQYQRAPTDKSSPLKKILAELLPSEAFRKWLGLITGLPAGALKSQNAIARRFRKGQDYALASEYQSKDQRLEYTIGLTPNADDAVPNGTANGTSSTDEADTDTNGVKVDTSGEVDPGGQEIYIETEGDENSPIDQMPKHAPKRTDDPAVYKTGNELEDDSPLFLDGPSWNTLSIVYRDQGTLRCVKYVSEAGRDRWDIKGEIELDYDHEEMRDLPSDDSADADEEDVDDLQGEYDSEDEEEHESEDELSSEDDD